MFLESSLGSVFQLGSLLGNLQAQRIKRYYFKQKTTKSRENNISKTKNKHIKYLKTLNNYHICFCSPALFAKPQNTLAAFLFPAEPTQKRSPGALSCLGRVGFAGLTMSGLDSVVLGFLAGAGGGVVRGFGAI